MWRMRGRAEVKSTARLVAILGCNFLAEAFVLIGAQLGTAHLEEQERLKKQKREARLKESGLPEFAQEVFRKQ